MEALLTLLSKLETIKQTVLAIQALAPDGNGAAKAEAVLNLVTMADPQLQQVGELVPKAISVVYNLFKASGQLPPVSTTPATPATPTP